MYQRFFNMQVSKFHEAQQWMLPLPVEHARFDHHTISSQPHVLRGGIQQQKIAHAQRRGCTPLKIIRWFACQSGQAGVSHSGATFTKTPGRDVKSLSRKQLLANEQDPGVGFFFQNPIGEIVEREVVVQQQLACTTPLTEILRGAITTSSRPGCKANWRSSNGWVRRVSCSGASTGCRENFSPPQAPRIAPQCQAAAETPGE